MNSTTGSQRCDDHEHQDDEEQRASPDIARSHGACANASLGISSNPLDASEKKTQRRELSDRDVQEGEQDEYAIGRTRSIVRLIFPNAANGPVTN